jgi:hypothetical protein
MTEPKKINIDNDILLMMHSIWWSEQRKIQESLLGFVTWTELNCGVKLNEADGTANFLVDEVKYVNFLLRLKNK